MHPLFLNIVWPALYVSQTFYRFWILILLTIFTEGIILLLTRRASPRHCLLIAVVGNAASGLVGTFLMTIAMVLWHLLADIFLGGTFHPVNWVATFILMCIGSVAIELWTVKLAFGEPIRRMFAPLLIGNVLSYVVIAWMTWQGRGTGL